MKKILSIVFLLSLCLGVLAGCSGEIPPAPTDNVGGEDIMMHIVNSADEEIPDGSVAVYQITEIRVPAMQDTAEAYLKNPSVNNAYYLIFELRLPNGDDYKTLYTSNFVSPGTETPRMDLSEKLPAGEYDAVLVVTAYRMHDVTPVNNIELPVKLIAK